MITTPSTAYKILIVDDEPDNFDVLESLLFGENYHLGYASSSANALRHLEETSPDLILLDVMMPEVDGIQLCKTLKGSLRWSHIPIIMVTALSSKEDLAQCLEAGADDFISKPVNRVELRARVRSLLRMKQQHDCLRASLQLREDMANMIVHDLRNPLTGIIMACSLLQMMDLQEKPRHKVEQIVICGQQLQSMIDSLLLMAKLETGKLVVERTAIDLNALGQSVLSDLEAIAAQKHIELVGILPDVGHYIEVDITLFRRIIDNLLSNAIKFSPSKSQVILRIETQSEGKVRLQVADIGPGVSEELRHLIFEKFEVGRVHHDISQTGLGLAFCKMAVEAHGGKIFVEANQPRGSIFTVEL